MNKLKLTMEEVNYMITLLRKCSNIVDVVPDTFKRKAYTDVFEGLNNGLSNKEIEKKILQEVDATMRMEEEFDNFLVKISAKLVYAREKMLQDGDNEMVLELLKDLEV
jgi:mevalonate kinase